MGVLILLALIILSTVLTLSGCWPVAEADEDICELPLPYRVTMPEIAA